MGVCVLNQLEAVSNGVWHAVWLFMLTVNAAEWLHFGFIDMFSLRTQGVLSLKP